MVIGWGRSIKIAAIRTKPSQGVNGIDNIAHLSSTKYADIVASFQTSYFISGIAPYGDALVVLAYISEEYSGGIVSSNTIPSRQVTYDCFLGANLFCPSYNQLLFFLILFYYYFFRSSPIH